MPFYEEVGIDLDGPAPVRVKINWKTCQPIPDRPLGPLSARHAQHDATPACFLGDLPGRPHSHAGSLEAVLGSTAKWSRSQTAAIVPHVDLVNFSRSGVRHMKPRKLRQPPAPKEVPLKGHAAQAQASGASPLMLPGARSSRSTLLGRSIVGVDQMPDILQRLIAGDGVQDMIVATGQLLRLVQGEGEDAAGVRAAVGRYAGILRSLVKLIKLCQPPYQVPLSPSPRALPISAGSCRLLPAPLMNFLHADLEADCAWQAHKPVVMKTLSQLTFYNKANSEILCDEMAFMPQLIIAVFSGVDLLQLETARLINNLAASSELAAQRLCDYPGMLEAIKRLCGNSNFPIRFRAASTVNCLTRHALGSSKMGAALAKSEVVAELRAVSVDEAGSEEQHRQYGFMLTCAAANSMGSIERRTWAADEYHLETAVLVLKRACDGNKFAGVTCRVLPVLVSIRCIAISEANKKALFNKKLVEVLAQFVEEWEEDSSKSLGDQLQCLELAMALLLTMLTVDGKTVVKKALFQTEVKARLHALDFGASLFRAIKLRHSHIAVNLAQRLIDELQLRLPFQEQQSFEAYTNAPAEGLQQESFSSTSSTRMLGTSHSIPRSLNPDFLHPLAAGAGGGPPAIPRPISTAPPETNTPTFDAEFYYGDAMAERPSTNLLWDTSCKRPLVRLCHQHILLNWRRLKAELSAFQPENVSEEGVVPSVDVYKIFGAHRIWLEADDWQAVCATWQSRASHPTSLHLPSLLVDLQKLLATDGTAGGWQGGQDSEVYQLSDGGHSPTSTLDTGLTTHKRYPDERLALLAGLLLKQVEAGRVSSWRKVEWHMMRRIIACLKVASVMHCFEVVCTLH
jgi:hypothetical protein